MLAEAGGQKGVKKRWDSQLRLKLSLIQRAF